MVECVIWTPQVRRRYSRWSSVLQPWRECWRGDHPVFGWGGNFYAAASGNRTPLSKVWLRKKPTCIQFTFHTDTKVQIYPPRALLSTFFFDNSPILRGMMILRIIHVHISTVVGLCGTMNSNDCSLPLALTLFTPLETLTPPAECPRRRARAEEAAALPLW